MSRIRVGIVGAGQMASLHAAAYKEIEDAEVYAVCDRREEVAINKALEWGASRSYTDYADLIADPNVDAVEVLTPHHLHHEIVMAAAAAGKAIHVAKPLAIGLKTAERVLDLVEQRGVLLQVSEPSFHFRPLLEAQGFIESGEIGSPMAIRMKVTLGSPSGGWPTKPESWLWRMDPARCGGGALLFDHGYHKLAAALLLMGPVEQVSAWVSRTEIHPGYFLDAPTLVFWKHVASNRVGSLELTYAPQLLVRSTTYPVVEFIEVTGTRGMLWVNQGCARVLNSAPLELMRDSRLFSFGDLDEDWREAVYASVKNFVLCMRGQARPTLSGGEALRVLRFALAAREAAHHGGTVVVGDVPRGA